MPLSVTAFRSIFQEDRLAHRFDGFADRSVMRPIERLAQNLFISPPTLAHGRGIVMALESDEELDTNVARYARNRQILLSNLPQAGIDTFAPADGKPFICMRKFPD